MRIRDVLGSMVGAATVYLVLCCGSSITSKGETPGAGGDSSALIDALMPQEAHAQTAGGPTFVRATCDKTFDAGAFPVTYAEVPYAGKLAIAIIHYENANAPPLPGYTGTSFVGADRRGFWTKEGTFAVFCWEGPQPSPPPTVTVALF